MLRRALRNCQAELFLCNAKARTHLLCKNKPSKFFSPMIIKKRSIILFAPVSVFVTYFFPRLIGVHLRTYNFITWVLTTSQPTTKATGGET